MRNKGFTYLAMGDSITWMKNAGAPAMTKGADFYNAKLRNYIRGSSIGSCRLINKGLGGSVTANMVQNLPWLGGIEADLVTIGIGTNDCINDPDLTKYQTNLGMLIDRLRSLNPNVKIVLCTPPRTLDSARNAVIQPYRDAMATVATNKNVSVCRWENAWTSGQDTTMISTDNVHPTPTGHTSLYNTLLPVVQGLFSI